MLSMPLSASVNIRGEYASLDTLDNELLDSSDITLHVLRLDQFDAGMSGNKYFKLKYNIEAAIKNNKRSLLSFGGAFSNHLHALSMAGKANGMPTIGLVRGERIEPLNPTLSDAEAAGMQLHFLSRSDYRRRNDDDFLETIHARFPNAYVIPEGGSNLLGVKGCGEIGGHIEHHLGNNFDTVLVPCGTAATLAGVAAALPNKNVIGISVSKKCTVFRQRGGTVFVAIRLWPA